MEDKIYHYTDVFGLFGVLESQQIYATHFGYLNDPLELNYAKNKFEQHIGRAVSDYSRNEGLSINLEKTRRELGLTSSITDEDALLALYQKEAVAFSNSVFDTWMKYCDVFVSSFSRHLTKNVSDVGLLSQWRAYGKTGGYALEFDGKKLSELGTVEFDNHCYSYLRPGDVSYGEIKKRANFDDIIMEFVKHVYSAPKSLDDAKFKDFNELFLDALVFTKPHVFFEESEWRIGAIAQKEELKGFREGVPVKEIHFQPKGGAIVPYIKLFENCAGLPITGVLIGPHKNQARRKTSIEMFLKSKSLGDIEVRVANAEILDEL